MCEGTRTEPRYLEALRRQLRIGGIKVEALGRDPMTLLHQADEMRSRRKSSGEEPYDRVWVVFDAERHGTHDIPTILQEAARLKITVALSTPSFEAWLLAHLEYSTRMCTTSEEAERRLKRHVPDYEKGTYDPEFFLARIDKAMEHAARLRAYHAQPHGAGEVGNPGTSMDLLVAWIRGSAGT